jgi:hypothetical protein
VNDLDLHADAEQWPDNLDDAVCGHCGGPRVAFIPVWENGSGILTAAEIAACIRKAGADIERLALRDLSGEFRPSKTGSQDDVIMYIEGHRDGTFRAVITTEYTSHGQVYVKYGTGSTTAGMRGWQTALAKSSGTEEITTSEDLENGQRVYLGAISTLNFRRREVWVPNPEQREILRAREAVRDRHRPTTSWERHKAALRARAGEQDPPARAAGNEG